MFLLKTIEKSDGTLKAAIASIGLRGIGAIALQPNVVVMKIYQLTAVQRVSTARGYLRVATESDRSN
ncbi:MAG: hypothetical protein RMZ41_024655 [Nostoc sp. DedVER02]|uniref:hypothetical protein n=1 Tax=unclassified Nostoc TaxID=2593658 RepID=UPI002AD4703E|nr:MULTISPECIES: hypothetical protein [unclassified Nostoc]MDZ7987321.1 hypothetical protein [Nostoc sp. DedVER02]MDZ8110829.1 hypothetical protein [Nostoc sp. DedVER01b]